MKRSRVVFAGGSICAVTLLLMFVFWLGSESHDEIPELPVKSIPHEVVTTCNGCCLWAENVRIFVTDDDGNQLLLAEHENVSEDDILSCRIPEADGAYINAISGENHISYKLNYSSDIWEKQSVPQIRKSSVVRRTT